MTKRITHNWIAQIIVGGIAGTIAGFIVYEVTRLTGRGLYMLIGGIAGAVLVFAVQRFWSTARRTVQLTEVTLTLPVISELKFVVDDQARRVAWQLYVEIATRVSTQPLGDGEGFIREALTSLYGLFGTTRDMLKAGLSLGRRSRQPDGRVPRGHHAERLPAPLPLEVASAAERVREGESGRRGVHLARERGLPP